MSEDTWEIASADVHFNEFSGMVNRVTLSWDNGKTTKELSLEQFLAFSEEDKALVVWAMMTGDTHPLRHIAPPRGEHA